MVDHAAVVDPEGHRVTFENDRVRIIDVDLAEGSVVPMHAHPPRAIVAITRYRLRSTDAAGESVVIERAPGDVVWSDGEEHEAEVLIGPARTIEIEVK